MQRLGDTVKVSLVLTLLSSRLNERIYDPSNIKLFYMLPGAKSHFIFCTQVGKYSKIQLILLSDFYLFFVA